MKLTTRSKYGTRLLLDIALHSENGPVTGKDIARREGLSLKYLEKLLKKLGEAGYIKGKRGPNGGNVLTMPPEEISIGAVVQVLDGQEDLKLDCGNEQATFLSGINVKRIKFILYMIPAVAASICAFDTSCFS